MKEFSEQLEYFKKENKAKDNEITFLENKLKELNEEEKVCFLFTAELSLFVTFTVSKNYPTNF